MNKTFNRLATFTVDQRWAVALLLSVVTTVCLIGYRDPNLILNLFQADPDQGETGSADENTQTSSRQRRVPQVDPFTLSRSDAVIVVESEEFFTVECAKALRKVVEKLEELDQVAGVVWMDRVPPLNIFGLPEPLFPRSEASANRFAAAKQKAMDHPLVGGQLLSTDGRTLLMLVTLDFRFTLDDTDATSALRETAEAATAEFPDAGLSFRVTGRIPATLAAIQAHEANQLKYQLIGYGMILLMTIILFRGIRAVIIVAVAPMIGVFWTLGAIQFFDFDNNPLIDVILPVLISLVGLTDGVHLMVQIRKLRAAGRSARDAARTGVQQVGLACFLTSLTTAIGFGSLTMADSEWVQQFGKCSVVGVILTFISVVTVIPFLCSTWLGQQIQVGLEKSPVDRHLNRISVIIDLVLKRRRLFSAAGIVATIALFGVSMTLRPDHRESDGLPQTAEATQAMQHMDKAFGGLDFSRVEVNWTDDVPSDSAEVLIVVSKVDDVLRAEELIGHPLSIRNLIDAQPGSGPPEERMSLMELLPPPLKRAFFTPERNWARVDFRVQDLGIAAYGPVFEHIQQELENIRVEHPQFNFEMKGNAVWRWEHLYQIVVDLAKSLGTASVVIFLVLSLVYRSVRVGLISIIPNMFPLVLTGAYLALVGYNLEIVMVLNFTVCLGIAVDDTIHFLTRYMEESAVNNDQNVAIRKAFTGVGTALIMTTTVLVAGFSTVMFSDSRDHQIFATMGALTIGSALFGDLVFLPALLGTFAPRQKDSAIVTEPADVCVEPSSV